MRKGNRKYYEEGKLKIQYKEGRQGGREGRRRQGEGREAEGTEEGVAGEGGSKVKIKSNVLKQLNSCFFPVV